MYISAFLLCTSSTALSAACIFASSPTRIASAIPFSLAALTASRTASSCAQQTETVFFSHLVTCSTKSPKLLLIFLTSLNFSFLYRKPSTTHSLLQSQTYRITKKTKGQLYLIIPPDTQVCLLLCCIKPL